MIAAIVGGLGVGKTAFLTLLGKRDFEKGRAIYSNYPVTYPHHIISHPFQLTQMRAKDPKTKKTIKSTSILDEFWLWASSIAPLRKLQQSLAIVYTRSRKEGWDLFYTTQRFKNVHNRLRAITDIMFLPEPRPVFADTPEFFEVKILNMDTQRIIGRERFYLADVKDLYDTNADIYGFEGIFDMAEKELARAGLAEFHRGKEETPLEELRHED